MRVYFSQVFDRVYMFNGEKVPLYVLFEKAGLYDVGGILTSFFHVKGRKGVVEELQGIFSGRCECFMVDSGAFSWYKKNVFRNQRSRQGGVDKGLRQMNSYDWVTSKEFEQFFEDYCGFLEKVRANGLQVPYVTLDVIGNAELTWEMYVEMKRRGFSPIPVWHYGEDFGWLRRYVEDCEYVGIGGVVSRVDAPGRSVQAFGKIFSYLVRLVGKDTVLQKKFHLFAQTGTDVLKEVPFDTVDSSTPEMCCVYAELMVSSGERLIRFPVSAREKRRTQVVCASRGPRFGAWLGIVEEKLCRGFTLVTGIEPSNVYEVLTRVGEDYNVRSALSVLMFFDFIRNASKVGKEERLERLLKRKGE